MRSFPFCQHWPSICKTKPKKPLLQNGFLVYWQYAFGNNFENQKHLKILFMKQENCIRYMVVKFLPSVVSVAAQKKKMSLNSSNIGLVEYMPM